MSKFIKHTDRKGTDIIEGEVKPGNVFSIKRFICKVQEQETEKETQEIADMLVKVLSNLKK
ncbi:hypothetical protein ACNQGP_00650 [Flavobacterium sp. GT2N3]|uniref:hypothetical protein n=1 Tax=unclassified Flavobacterium TaxID=196869 RepID=UPI003AB0947E